MLERSCSNHPKCRLRTQTFFAAARWILPGLLWFLFLPGLAAAQQPCVPTSTTLCLNEGRFQVEVQWEDFQGHTGPGQAVLFGSDDSGLFWFFDGQNWEMLVKVINGCTVNDHFWVFSAATTNVAYTLTVTDSLTGDVRAYPNPLGQRADAVTDTAAFATCTAQDEAQVSAALGSSRLEPPAQTAEAGGRCLPGPTTFCLNDDRFEVEVDWRDFQGHSGTGKTVPVSSDDSGLFWFFNDQNWELLVKVIDGCPLNDRFWVFSAATTNVEYTLRVTDTVTGTRHTYRNPSGRAAPAVTDTDAFATCDAETTGPPQVRFVSDASVILSTTKNEAHLEVEVVDPEGNPAPGADVSFLSDSPQAFPVTEVSDTGAVVRAVGTAPGFATITARYGDSEARATVALARPAPQTVLIDSDDVLARSASEVLLVRTAADEALVPGQILVSGNRAGLLERVVAVTVEPSAVRVQTGRASLPEAFEELHLEAVGEPVDASLRLGEDGNELALRDGLGRLLARSVIQGVSCKTENGSTAGIHVQGGNVSLGFRLTPNVVVDISGFSLRLFRAQLTGSIRLSGNTGSVTFSTDVAATAECSVELSTLSIPRIPVSVFSFGFDFVPSVGVQASAVFDGPSLTFTGPHGHATGTATAGIQYTPASGWQSIGGRSWDGELVPFTVDLDLRQEFTASAGPFVKLEIAAIADLGRGFFSKKLADFRFAELKGSGAIDLEMKSPFDPSKPAYVGPRWELGLRAQGDLKAELAGGVLFDLLDYLGIDTSFDTRLNLFDLSLPLLSSPAPTFIDALTPTDSCVGLPQVRSDRGESATFRISGEEADGRALVWASEGGDPPLAEITEGPYAGENGRAVWTPDPGTTGTYRAYPRLAVDAISRNAPYAAGPDLFTEVTVAAGDGVPVIESIDPVELEVGNGGMRSSTLTFTDPDAGVNRVRFDVVERDCPGGCGIEAGEFDPGVLKQTEGEIELDVRCINEGDADKRVVFDVTLSDCQGNTSDPFRWTVLCTTGGGVVETPPGSTAGGVVVAPPRR